MSRPLAFYEFFAGGGMARAGLGASWHCAFANDFDRHKAQTYRANWGGDDLVEGDVWRLEPADLPGRADLAWASSPCQDLSLAGTRSGLDGRRSSAFWGFWRLVEALAAQGRAPRALVVENVCGLLTSGQGRDFTALCGALDDAGYRFGALEIDAEAFLPQSRPRLFVVATREAPPASLIGDSVFHSRGVRAAHDRLPEALQRPWIWWAAPAPARRNTVLADLIEPDAAWSALAETRRLVELMAPPHRARVSRCDAEGGIATGFRRMRRHDGETVQRLEVRSDGVAGCLRTPRGGSSRQFVIATQSGRIRSRRLTAREGARLMGLPDDYLLPEAQTTALHVIGDGVAVPVVRHLAAHLLEPLLGATCTLMAAE